MGNSKENHYYDLDDLSIRKLRTKFDKFVESVSMFAVLNHFRSLLVCFHFSGILSTLASYFQIVIS